MKNWQDEYGKRINAIHEKIQESLGTDVERLVYYSAYKTKNDLPVNNINTVAFKGKAILVAKHDDFWGDGSDYESDVVKNPTWLQIAVLANAMIQTTGDFHHQFLEGVHRTKETKDGVAVFEFAMGS
jgi:hypothetical protein